MDKSTFWSKLSWILNGNKCEFLGDLSIPSNVQTMLIYNTNDLCLSETQFDALMESIDSTEKIYVAQNDFDKIFELDFPVSYAEYQFLDLFSMTYLTSNQFDWLVIIDENLESGIGVLATKSDLIEKYSSRYKDGLNDIQNLIAFHYKDASRNPHSIENLIKILSLWHGKRAIQ